MRPRHGLRRRKRHQPADGARWLRPPLQALRQLARLRRRRNRSAAKAPRSMVRPQPDFTRRLPSPRQICRDCAALTHRNTFRLSRRILRRQRRARLLACRRANHKRLARHRLLAVHKLKQTPQPQVRELPQDSGLSLLQG